MAGKTTAGDKLNTALKSANDAVKEMKNMGKNTKIALTDDFKALSEAIGHTNVAHRIADAKEYSVDKIKNAKEYSVDRVKEAGTYMDENVRQRPYHYIAGAAVFGLLVGLLIGRK